METVIFHLKTRNITKFEKMIVNYKATIPLSIFTNLEVKIQNTC